MVFYTKWPHRCDRDIALERDVFDVSVICGAAQVWVRRRTFIAGLMAPLTYV